MFSVLCGFCVSQFLCFCPGCFGYVRWVSFPVNCRCVVFIPGLCGYVSFFENAHQQKKLHIPLKRTSTICSSHRLVIRITFDTFFEMQWQNLGPFPCSVDRSRLGAVAGSFMMQFDAFDNSIHGLQHETFWTVITLFVDRYEKDEWGCGSGDEECGRQDLAGAATTRVTASLRLCILQRCWSLMVEGRHKS